MQNTTFNISNKTHTGSWHNIIVKYPNDTILGNIFTIRVTPEIAPKNSTYGYAVLPNFDSKNIKSIDLSFEIVLNDKQAQIIKSKDSKVFLMSIYKPLKKKFKALGAIDFKQPGLYQLENIDNQWEITLADPTQKLDTMDIIFKGETYNFIMPDGFYKGKSIHKKLGK